MVMDMDVDMDVDMDMDMDIDMDVDVDMVMDMDMVTDTDMDTMDMDMDDDLPKICFLHGFRKPRLHARMLVSVFLCFRVAFQTLVIARPYISLLFADEYLSIHPPLRE
jgi:hypothetical protein